MGNETGYKFIEERGRVSEKSKKYMLNALLVAYDLIAVCAAWFLALWLRFDGSISKIERPYLDAYIKFIPFYAMFCLPIFVLFRLYKSLWKYASVIEAVRVAEATFVTGVLHIVTITVLLKRMPLSYYAFGPVIQFALVLGIRYCYRFYLIARRKYTRDIGSLKRVMIIGAGEAGRNVLREIHRERV
jgi:FlaA1/EpsC-like NDP-sugar epimerase